MAVDQTEHVATPRPSAPPAAHAMPTGASKGVRWGLPILFVVVLVGVVIGVWYSGHTSEKASAAVKSSSSAERKARDRPERSCKPWRS